MNETPLTKNIKPGQAPPPIADYERAGGYAAVRAAVTTMQPADITARVKDANMRGRGGAGVEP